MYINEKEVNEALDNNESIDTLTKKVTEQLQKAFKEREKQLSKEKEIKTARHRAAVALYDYLKLSGNLYEDVKIADVEKYLEKQTNYFTSTFFWLNEKGEFRSLNELLDKMAAKWTHL